VKVIGLALKMLQAINEKNEARLNNKKTACDAWFGWIAILVNATTHEKHERGNGETLSS
jgi:hypothetical protein